VEPVDMGHGHHHHVDPGAGDRRVFAAIAVNLGLTVAQIVGGIISGSLALIADALHNFSDAISLIIAFAARRIARRPHDADMTFGYRRAEIVAALINYTTLIVIGLYLLDEAAMRLADPQPVAGWIIVIVAGVALVVDAVTALLTSSMSKSSMNIRAAFLHNVADAMGSVAVIVGGTLILLYDWRLIDPIITLMISAYILWHSWQGIGPVIRVLMLGSPDSPRIDEVAHTLCSADGVADVHALHLWRVQEHRVALQAHVVIEDTAGMDAVRADLKALLEDRFGITHSSLELEGPGAACHDRALIGSG